MVTRRQPSDRRRTGAKRPVPKKRAPKKEETNVLLWLVEMGKTIPPEELAKLPKDGARNLEFYLYGSPKQE